MLEYARHRSTIFSLLSDIIILSGVFLAHWSPVRIIAFICLDLEVRIFFCLVFMKARKEIDTYAGFLACLFLLSLFVLIDFYLLFSISYEFFLETSKSTDPEDIQKLFTPYYDVSFFLICSGLYHYSISALFIKNANKKGSDYYYLKNVVINLLMVPLVFFVGGYVALLFRSDIHATCLIIFLVAKQLDQFRNFSGLKRMKIASENVF